MRLWRLDGPTIGPLQAGGLGEPAVSSTGWPQIASEQAPHVLGWESLAVFRNIYLEAAVLGSGPSSVTSQRCEPGQPKLPASVRLSRSESHALSALRQRPPSGSQPCGSDVQAQGARLSVRVSPSRRQGSAAPPELRAHF